MTHVNVLPWTNGDARMLCVRNGAAAISPEAIHRRKR
jgi:hypothetical protein